MEKKKPQIIPINGVVQHYAWGGCHFIPELLGVGNATQKPFAELWMGTHERGPATIEQPNQTMTLAEWLQQHPEQLGKTVQQQFQGQLPFLFKVLDVKQMLSIQSHPTKAQAEAGFQKENEQGIPLDARHRNFKDDNHKPEIMVALTPFWLLHGFQSAEAITKVLAEVPEFSPLKAQFESKNIASFYEFIMKMPQPEVDKMLAPLKKRLEENIQVVQADKNKPDFWALRAFQQHVLPGGGYDRGIFSIYLFNLVSLQPGESIYQGAGIPHAYLEGVNMELMANSDNVFRGGLTPKHIDVPELMKHLVFDPVTPHVQHGDKRSSTEKVFPSPAPDFELSQIDIDEKHSHAEHVNPAPQILIVMKGEARFDGMLTLQRGRSCFVPAGQHYEITAEKPATLFKATVPGN